jgi:hypothetical protein
MTINDITGAIITARRREICVKNGVFSMLAFTVLSFLTFSTNGNEFLQAAKESQPMRLELLGRIPGSADDVVGHLAVQGSHVYVTKEDDLRVVDVADPAKPRVVGSLKFKGRVGAVAVAGSHAYVLNEEYLRIVDIAKPAALRLVASHKMPGGLLWDITLAGKYA